MEDGEIALHCNSNVTTGIGYDPAFEWPDDGHGDSPDFPASDKSPSSSPWPSLRLLIVRSSILSKKCRLVVLDAYDEAQFGRDVAPAGSETPRVRLKEMEVSKLHATAYWDKQRREWAVVDMGSMHGTFLKRPSDPDRPGTEGERLERGTRLSPARTASVPRPLHHLDLLTIGSTTFMCHIHMDRKPCAMCMSSGVGDIPLFSDKGSGHGPLKRPRDEGGRGDVTTEPRDSKKALTMLKRSLLMRHEEDHRSRHPPSKPLTATYVDRSARRRALHPGSALDSPGITISGSESPGVPLARCDELPQLPPPLEKPPSPAPLPESNIGRRLLLKQGWQPGTSLGYPDEKPGLVEPLEVSSTKHRAGLGMPQAPAFSPSLEDWKESAKQKRWDSAQASEPSSRG
ncbi:hypothetical protein BV22DRAFT_1126847 [Leucogyrophana mollusca]|uniref:Uncharacterized protein n=1 Tax=Leucogyrophana mollusca TaxID=85980 RepID=A0ACB8BSF4_9AGAM|nr:hypothetical protein BV22DRAFT_1126847 [Leucogyrophana mollusca]